MPRQHVQRALRFRLNRPLPLTPNAKETMPLPSLRQSSFALCAVLVACGSESEPAPPALVGHAQQGIINGTVDTAHPAVVRHESQGFCTATIVKVEGSTGYALTAAHCIDQNTLGKLKQGQDADQPDRVYNITKHAVHPDYGKATAFDFAMVTFEGADANTPWLPILDPAKDSYKPGFPLTFVGYGIVKQGPGGDNSERRVIENKITSASPLRFVFDQMQKGFCSGDSGGPGLTVQQPERVAAVIQAVSGGKNGCSDQGIAGRISSVYNEFIGPYLEGKPFELQSCDLCRSAVTSSESLCLDIITDCFNNAKCLGYAQCLEQCATQSCVDACADQHPDGKVMYGQIATCSCQQCASECDGDPQCDEPPPATSTTTSASSTTAGVGGSVATSTTAGVGGAGATGAGGGSEQNDPGPVVESGCAVAQARPSVPSSKLQFLFAALGLAVCFRRRQA